MGKGDKLTYTDVNTLVGSLLADAETIKNTLQSCSNMVNNDIGTPDGIWYGTSASQYAQNFEDLESEAQALYNMVLQQSESLKVALKAIADADGVSR